MTLLLANAERLRMLAMASALEPPPSIEFLDWAESNVVIAEGSFPGRYNRALFPYFDEILRALSPSDPCRFVTFVGSAQVGKTTVANVFTCGTMALGKGSFLYAHPTEDNARRWSKIKLAQMVNSMPALRAEFQQRSRDGADAQLYKERRDGNFRLLITGANSPASLSQITIENQVQDDLAKWEMNAAGDPEAQADNRSRAVEFAKILKVSTPLVMPGCRITKNFEAGSQEYPYVPCPHCDHYQVLEWENMLSNLDLEKPEEAHFSCVSCSPRSRNIIARKCSPSSNGDRTTRKPGANIGASGSGRPIPTCRASSELRGSGLSTGATRPAKRPSPTIPPASRTLRKVKHRHGKN